MGHRTGADTTRAALEFLKAGIADEFDLLAAGVLGTDRGASQPIEIPRSRSIPVHTQQ